MPHFDSDKAIYSEKTDIFSLGIIFEKMNIVIKSNFLAMLSFLMTAHKPEDRLSLSYCRLSLISHFCMPQPTEPLTTHRGDKLISQFIAHQQKKFPREFVNDYWVHVMAKLERESAPDFLFLFFEEKTKSPDFYPHKLKTIFQLYEHIKDFDCTPEEFNLFIHHCWNDAEKMHTADTYIKQTDNREALRDKINGYLHSTHAQSSSPAHAL
jgi:hypothetical protein